MYNWRLLLLAFLAGLQPITSFTERNLVDGREQCCDRESTSALRDLRETRLALHGVYRFSKPENRRVNQREDIREIRQYAVKRDAHSFARSGERDGRVARIGHREDRISERQYRERVFSTSGDREYVRGESRIYSRSLERPERSRANIRENFARNTMRQNNHRSQFAKVSDKSKEAVQNHGNAQSVRSSVQSRPETRRFRDTAGDIFEIRNTRDARNSHSSERDDLIRNNRRNVREGMKLHTFMPQSENPDRRFNAEDKKARVRNSERQTTRVYERQTTSQEIRLETHRTLKDATNTLRDTRGLHSRVSEKRSTSLDRTFENSRFLREAIESRRNARDSHSRDSEKRSTAFENNRTLREDTSRSETGHHRSRDNERRSASLHRTFEKRLLREAATSLSDARDLNSRDNERRSALLHRSTENRRILRETASLRRDTPDTPSRENERRSSSSHRTSETGRFLKETTTSGRGARDFRSRDNDRRSLNRTPENRSILRETATRRDIQDLNSRNNDRRSTSLDRSFKNRQILREKAISRDNAQEREEGTAYRRRAVVKRLDLRHQQNEDDVKASRRESRDRTSSLRNTDRFREETRFGRAEKPSHIRHDETTRRSNERMTRSTERRQVSGTMVGEYARSSDNENKDLRSLRRERDTRLDTRSRSVNTIETRDRVEYRNARYISRREPLPAYFRSNVESARNRENFIALTHKLQDKEASAMNWQYIFYTLQGIYLCSILMELLTGNNPGKNKRSPTWWPSSQISMKMD